MDFKKALPILDRFISWATPKRIVMLALVSLVLIVTLTIFEKRNTIATSISEAGTSVKAPKENRFELTDDVKDQIVMMVNRSPNIAGIMVFSANLRINQRDLIFFYTSDKTLDLMLKKHVEMLGVSSPMFTADDKTNTHMVSIINGEFSCQKYKDTIAFYRVPEAGSIVPQLCRVSIPPYYGEFSGYILFGLKKTLTKVEADDLKLDAAKLSTDIYFRTLVKNRQ